MKNKWNKDLVYRTTKCFSPRNNGYAGRFPINFMKYLESHNWIKGKLLFLCSGKVDYPGFKVDINPDVKPDLVMDARKTNLPDKSFDTIVIDPPYSLELADKLYNTKKYFGSINQFTKEANRLIRKGGYIITLSYEVPKRLENCNIIAVIGVYQTISVAHIRCLCVFERTN